jgi:hypothetical protein
MLEPAFAERALTPKPPVLVAALPLVLRRQPTRRQLHTFRSRRTGGVTRHREQLKARYPLLAWRRSPRARPGRREPRVRRCGPDAGRGVRGSPRGSRDFADPCRER